jgi:hypothetical protein
MVLPVLLEALHQAKQGRAPDPSIFTLGSAYRRLFAYEGRSNPSSIRRLVKSREAASICGYDSLRALLKWALWPRWSRGSSNNKSGGVETDAKELWSRLPCRCKKQLGLGSLITHR